MIFKGSFLLLISGYLLGVSGGFVQDCRAVDGMPNRNGLDVDKMLGGWYKLKSGPNSKETEQCMFVEYKRNPANKFILDAYSKWTTPRGFPLESNNTFITVEPNVPSWWNFHLFDTVLHQKILATDYDSWLLTSTCLDAPGGGWNNLYMIHSRTRSLAPEVLSMIEATIQSFTGTPISDLKAFDQSSKCPA